MSLKLEQELSKAEIIKQVDELKKQIDAMRPLAEEVEGRVMQKLRLDWNYHSNAIEGNRLSYGETVAFLMEGITAKGKPLKDHLDIRGHNEAIMFLLSIVKDNRALTESDIRGLHKMILVEPYQVKAQTAEGLSTSKQITLGEYKTSPNHVKTATGETHYYATPEDTPAKMQELMAWYNTAIAQPDIHPLVIAALFHHKFVAIHPFDDGNGRLSRVLMNLILMQNGYPPVVIKMDDRQNYYSLLSRADNNEHWPFVEYIAENMLASLNLYLKAAQGGDIEEEDDIDKEIALFRLQIMDQVTDKERKRYIMIQDLLKREINPLLTKLFKVIEPFEGDFISCTKIIIFEFNNGFNTPNVSLIDNKVLEDIGVHFNNCTGVEVNLDFEKFKNHSNDFSVHFTSYIRFEGYEYEVYGTLANLILSKLYHENLTAKDQKKIIRSFVDDIKNQIQENIK